jgi:hypothetical protein
MVQRKKLSLRKPPSQRPGRSGEGGGGSRTEKTFNLFLFVDGDPIIQLGACCHEQEGSDRQKLSFLQSRVEADLPGAERFPIPDRYKLVRPGGTGTTGLRYQSYLDLSRLGKHLELFEEVFVHFGAPNNPLMCITPVVDGKPRVDTVTGF